MRLELNTFELQNQRSTYVYVVLLTIHSRC